MVTIHHLYSAVQQGCSAGSRADGTLTLARHTYFKSSGRTREKASSTLLAHVCTDHKIQVDGQVLRFP